HGLQMPCRIHTLVQDADHIHTASSLDVEHQMAADAVTAVPQTNLVASPSTIGCSCDALDRCPDLKYVDLSLILVPAFLGEVPDRREVTLRGRREPIGCHDLFEATKASKSKSSGSPLS